ncbi:MULTISPECIES: hypothetical protein [Hyphomicrobiales]|uniref:Outer membrane protein n=1 Tax=Bradyrhizobium lupini HPC(L) TaxID=1229491 RepID=A0ABN0HKC2_RHILU|nr:hypothetical protein [Agrobacterium pusense]EKJ95059.1 hypothetical protein C241_14883 [Bradyrhizobium lupini HPC(L)]OOO19713.1 hypothetical protein BTE56_13400 [Agrobacterium pusense]WKD47941.1 hypothetical protein M8C82_25570 [Agrobacterium pusense]SDF64115.1 hypothetical protein SAMN05421750_12035 [Agrobacterium pusense]
MKRHLTVLAVLLAAAAPAGAADFLPAYAPQPVEERPDHWTFSFSPYLWIAGITGDTAVFGLPEVHSDESFGDILKDVDFGFMGAGEARYGDLSILTDISYARVTSSDATPRGIVADSISLKQETFTAMVGVGYTILENEQGRLDAVGGAKLWWTETTIGFHGGALDGVSGRDEATWVDGIVGFRGVYSLTPTWYLTGWGLVGAGGADIDWDVMAGVGYKWKDSISAIAGYRALGVNYSSGGLTSDIVEHGPIVGLVFHF